MFGGLKFKVLCGIWYRANEKAKAAEITAKVALL